MLHDTAVPQVTMCGIASGESHDKRALWLSSSSNLLSVYSSPSTSQEENPNKPNSRPRNHSPNNPTIEATAKAPGKVLNSSFNILSHGPPFDRQCLDLE